MPLTFVFNTFIGITFLKKKKHKKDDKNAIGTLLKFTVAQLLRCTKERKTYDQID